MRKFLPVLLIILISILSVLIFFVIKKDASDTTSQTTDDQPNTFSGGAVPASVPTDFENGILQVSTKVGAVKQIDGSFTAQDVTELSEDYNWMFESYDSDETEMFDIYYDEVAGALLVTLDREPIETARALAVRRLENKLGLRANELCDLNISVITNSYVSTVYAGYELGVPNCPGAISLTPGSTAI